VQVCITLNITGISFTSPILTMVRIWQFGKSLTKKGPRKGRKKAKEGSEKSRIGRKKAKTSPQGSSKLHAVESGRLAPLSLATHRRVSGLPWGLGGPRGGMHRKRMLKERHAVTPTLINQANGAYRLFYRPH